MSYTAPTAAQLKAKYPAFASVADLTVDLYLVDAGRAVDTTWTEGDYQTAIMLYACHLMVQAGIGTGAEAEANANGLTGYKRIKSGQLDLERTSKADSGAANVPDEYAGTTYGQQYFYLLRKNRGGPRVAVADAGTTAGFHPVLPPYWPYGV